VRGVQLTVGLLFLKIAWGLVAHPPASFDTHGLGRPVMVGCAGAALALLLLRRRFRVTLLLLALAAAVIAWTAGDAAALGPSAIEAPSFDGAVFWTALTVLVLPQVPLSFANSCLATADAARTYFGERAARVRPGRLATTFGLANLAGGAIGGMPAGLLHIGLLRDLRDARSLAFAAGVGTVGFAVDLAVALALGLALWWAPVAIRAAR
jgi:hypothetical protein